MYYKLTDRKLTGKYSLENALSLALKLTTIKTINQLSKWCVQQTQLTTGNKKITALNVNGLQFCNSIVINKLQSLIQYRKFDNAVDLTFKNNIDFLAGGW